MTEATIFMAALDKPTEAERAAFLEEACAAMSGCCGASRPC